MLQAVFIAYNHACEWHVAQTPTPTTPTTMRARRAMRLTNELVASVGPGSFGHHLIALGLLAFSLTVTASGFSCHRIALRLRTLPSDRPIGGSPSQDSALSQVVSRGGVQRNKGPKLATTFSHAAHRTRMHGGGCGRLCHVPRARAWV